VRFEWRNIQKGTNTDFIRKVRGIEAPPIVVSQLLDTPEARAVKARGGMVGDREVVGILLRKLLEPEQQNGALLDGFPRTKAVSYTHLTLPTICSV